MTGTYKTKTKEPCVCGNNRWKTDGDRLDLDMTEYSCRTCGHVRQITVKMVVDDF